MSFLHLSVYSPSSRTGLGERWGGALESAEASQGSGIVLSEHGYSFGNGASRHHKDSVDQGAGQRVGVQETSETRRADDRTEVPREVSGKSMNQFVEITEYLSVSNVTAGYSVIGTAPRHRFVFTEFTGWPR